jgi:serine/threonine-protein kinase
MWNVRIARRKVRSFEQCRHPAVVPFADVGTSGGMHYLAWPMVEGETLEKIVQRDGPLAPDVAAGYVLQAAQGLEVCHAQGLFHGLLKPSNLMLGPTGQVHILDLGIGSLLAETEGESLVDTMSSANAMASGLDCASPESIMDPNNLTPTGDQYSLGCTLYFLLAGRYPFPDGTAVEKMMAHQMKEPEPLGQLNPAVPAELVAVVERLMKKEPAARYASTAEVIAALEPFAAAAPRPAARPMARAPQPPPARRPAPPAPAIDDEVALGGPSAAPRVAPALSDTARNGARHKTPPPGSVPAATPRATPAVKPPRPSILPSRETVPPEPIEPEPTRSWEERLGPIGIALCAVLACAAAWLAAWKLF